MAKDMPPGGDVGGKMGRRNSEGGFGASAADLARGYQTVADPDMPAKTIKTPFGAMPNYERESYVPQDSSRQTPFRNAGKSEDAYAGGFVKRTPHNPNER
jgi:hypothetical protein